MLINITSKCNEQCTHCLVNALPNGMDSTIEDIKNVCIYLQVAKPLIVIISGGEITCSDHWYEKCKLLIDVVDTYNGTVILESNGSWFWDGRYDDIAPKMKNLLDLKTVTNMQISSNIEFYPNYQKWIKLKKKMEDFHPKVRAISDWQGSATHLCRLGRAKNLLKASDPKGYPSCAPLISRLCQLETFSNIDTYTSFMMMLSFNQYFCKPMVYAPTGGVFFGESPYCLPVDNIKRYDTSDLNKYKEELDKWFRNFLDHTKHKIHICNGCAAAQNFNEVQKNVLESHGCQIWSFDEQTSERNHTMHMNGKYIYDNK